MLSSRFRSERISAIFLPREVAVSSKIGVNITHSVEHKKCKIWNENAILLSGSYVIGSKSDPHDSRCVLSTTCENFAKFYECWGNINGTEKFDVFHLFQLIELSMGYQKK